jgi:hypothetical protein
MLIRHWRISIVVLALLVLATSYFWGPPFPEICEKKNPDTGDEECAAYYVASFAFLTLGRFLEDHHGSITGIATAVLAFITWRLVSLGREQSTTTRTELRAYLSVVVGTAIFQEKTKSLRFEARPMIINTGQTPAYKVRYTAMAEIIPDNLVSDFSFSFPANTDISQSSIGPKENRSFSAIVANYVPDKDVTAIKTGNGMALWVWGVVYYEDVFGRRRFTKFGQRLTWLKNGQVYGIYDPRLGDSD